MSNPRTAAKEGRAMDFVKAQLNRIQEQLGGLNASQKMLTGALVAIMVMTLVWWGRYAGQPEMEPVLNQAFSEGEISQITTELTKKGIAHSVSGGRVLVPVEKKMEVLADLGYAQLL